jgi:hypothetical protein
MATDKSKNQSQTKTDDYDDVEDSYAEPWKDPEEGDTVEGKYLGSREIGGNRGQSFPVYVLQQMDGTLISVAGSTLESRMSRIPEGTKVKVTYLGTQEHKGNDMKLFKIGMAKGTKLLPISFKPKNRPLSQSQSTGDDQIPF